MRRWLAIGVLGLLVACEGPGTWGPICTTYKEKVKKECELHGKKGLWPQVCFGKNNDGYLKAVDDMEKSIPPEGFVQKKYDAAEDACRANLESYDGLTKDPADFPR
jgi:hypothetical protein